MLEFLQVGISTGMIGLLVSIGLPIVFVIVWSVRLEGKINVSQRDTISQAKEIKAVDKRSTDNIDKLFSRTSEMGKVLGEVRGDSKVINEKVGNIQTNVVDIKNQLNILLEKM